MFQLIATVIAIIAAPLITLWVGTVLQKRRMAYERKYAIFRTLMGERATIASPAAVGAMNLIDVEFRRIGRSWISWHKYFELASSSDFARMSQSDQLERGRRAWAQLLLDMVKTLNIKENVTLDDLSRGYRPKEITDPEAMSRAIGLAIYQGVKDYGAIPIVQLPAPPPDSIG